VPTHSAHAATENIIGDFTICAASAIADLAFSFAIGAISSYVPTSDMPTLLKENVKDCLAWSIANAALEQITGEIVKFANSGFDGNPAYVTSIARELKRAADNKFLGFVESDELDGLPDFFREQVRQSVIGDYNLRDNFRNRSQSTFNSNTDLAGYVAGDFSGQGGWDTWYKLTQFPQNNPYGAYVLTQEEVNRRVQAGIEEKDTEINLGDGFLSKTVCDPVVVGTIVEYIYDDEGYAVGIAKEEDIIEQQCNIVTPGSAINDALQKSVGVGIDRIVQIDELNEAFSALFKGLLSHILSDDDGLRGAGNFIASSTGFTQLPIVGGDGGDGGGTQGVVGKQCLNYNQGPGTFTQLSKNGVFLEPTPGNEAAAFSVNVPAGMYESITVDLDVDVNQWDAPKRQNLFWLVNPDHADLYGYANILNQAGPSGNAWSVFSRYGQGMRAGDKYGIHSPRMVSPVGKTLHFSYTYSVDAVSLVVTENGKVITSASGPSNVPALAVCSGDEKFNIALGFGAGRDPNELPSYGWSYKNLVVNWNPDANATGNGRPVGGVPQP